MELAGLGVEVEPVTTTPPGPDGVARPLNGVLARSRADELDLPALRGWRDALADYMARAGLTGAAVAGRDQSR